MNDADAMALALDESAKAVGRTHPNPAVGAVIVKGGRVVGRGHTSPPGGPHAEVHALREAGKKAKGATLYCTLEPCSHQGRTGPCADAIIAAGITRVVFAVNDPNPLVNGKGEKKLRKAGLEVVKGVLEENARALNAPFFKFMERGLPYVTVKAALTLDGKTATSTGESKWISSAASRERVHELRNLVDAILVGAGTVKADDPLLTTRLPGGVPGHNAVRVVLDARLECDVKRKIFDTSVAPTVVITEALPTTKKARQLEARGVEVWSMPGSRKSLEPVMRALAERGWLHVLAEGGAGVHGALLTESLVDGLMLFIAPKLFGHDGLTWSGALGVKDPARAPKFEVLSLDESDGDLVVLARPTR